ncbi:MAG: DUF368 domain-containing protein [archaeon]
MTEDNSFFMAFKEHLLMFLRGLIMGIADIIPGVSAGTMALITGIYERLIFAIDGINRFFVKHIFKLNFRKLRRDYKKIDFAVFIPVLLGIAIALFSLAHLMDYLLLEWTSITYAFFFGLILASAVFVFQKADGNRSRGFFYLIIGFVFAFWFSGLKALDANHSLPILFASAAIAICATILPGISGSFMMVLLNQYETVIASLKNLWFDNLIVLVLGAIVGALAFSRLLNFLLKKYKSETMFFLTGLMLGSLRLPYDKIVTAGNHYLFAVIAAVIGFAIVFVLEKNFNKH